MERTHVWQGELSHGLPWLRTDGPQVVSVASGQPVRLRGINRSGLEHSEPWPDSPRPFTEAAGLSESDVQTIIAWGANLIRLPFNQDWALHGRGGRSAEDYLAACDAVVVWASRYGAYTLLDLQWLSADMVFGPPDSSQRVAPLPNADSEVLWARLAQRYRNEPAVLFDIFSEPHDPIPGDPHAREGVAADGSTFVLTTERVTMREWQPWARRLIGAIRREHPRALIFVSGVDWGYDLRGFPLTVAEDRAECFEHLVYSTHVYPWKGPPSRPHRWEPWPGPSKNPSWYQAFGHLADRVPVFAGEWGVADAESDRYAHRRWADRLQRYFDSLSMGWAAWSWYDRPHLVRSYAEGSYEPTPYGRRVRRYLAGAE